MPKKPTKQLQNVSSKKMATFNSREESLSYWMEAFLQFADNSSDRSRKEKRRDFKVFLNFMLEQVGHDQLQFWVPRVSRSFRDYLLKLKAPDNSRQYADATINRMLASLKVLSKWIHEHRPFPLGNPMAKIKNIPKTVSARDRALTDQEMQQILNAADLLVRVGGRSKDRHRYRDTTGRPQHKAYRPWRDRAIVYTYLGTAIRRAELPPLRFSDITRNGKRSTITVSKKGGGLHTCIIDLEALNAIDDYIEHERHLDIEAASDPDIIFLPAASNRNSSGVLSTRTMNNIWNKICDYAQVSGRTLHTARHWRLKNIMEKTKNPRAVQAQGGHQNIAYTYGYLEVTLDELGEIINEDQRVT